MNENYLFSQSDNNKYELSEEKEIYDKIRTFEKNKAKAIIPAGTVLYEKYYYNDSNYVPPKYWVYLYNDEYQGWVAYSDISEADMDNRSKQGESSSDEKSSLSEYYKFFKDIYDEYNENFEVNNTSVQENLTSTDEISNQTDINNNNTMTSFKTTIIYCVIAAFNISLIAIGAIVLINKRKKE